MLSVSVPVQVVVLATHYISALKVVAAFMAAHLLSAAFIAYIDLNGLAEKSRIVRGIKAPDVKSKVSE